MNNTVNKFSLAGDMFILKMHLRQSRFEYSVCGSFTKNKRVQKFFYQHETPGIFIGMN